MIFDMLEYYNMVKKYNADIIYSGPVWASGIESIGVALRKRLEFDGTAFSASQAVFSVFVEQMNNMLMYSEDKERFDSDSSRSKYADISKGLFVLGAKGRMYFIQSGNVIRKESAGLIQSRIDYLNTLDKAELRQFYKDQLKSKDTNLESKGAGLGLIEIARRASSKIEYSFTPLEDDGLWFYSIFVTIEKKGE